MPKNRIFECTNLECGFRFPVYDPSNDPHRCPCCGSLDPVLYIEFEPARVDPNLHKPFGIVLEGVLDNIRSGYNVGSMFRSSDGAGVARLHLCGLTPTPSQNAVAKTSLGAEQAVPWTYYPATHQAAALLHEHGFRLWALEGGCEAVSIFDMIPEAARPDARVALVCGNEVSGVDPQVLALCEERIAIPMAGIKDSLNVAVAFGVAVYLLRWAGRLQQEGDQNPLWAAG